MCSCKAPQPLPKWQTLPLHGYSGRVIQLPPKLPVKQAWARTQGWVKCTTLLLNGEAHIMLEGPLLEASHPSRQPQTEKFPHLLALSACCHGVFPSKSPVTHHGDEGLMIKDFCILHKGRNFAYFPEQRGEGSPHLRLSQSEWSG